jgi:hypothetical protein
MNSYSKSEIVGDRYITTRVVETVEHDLQIEKVSGEAIMSHIGAYRRIKFLFDGDVFSTQCGAHVIALNQSKTRCILCVNLTFDKDVESNWKRYIKTDGTKHWIEAI